MRQSTLVRLSALLAASALATTGCLQQEAEETATGETAAAGDGSVRILGAFSDAEADAFEESLKPFEQQSGIDVQYTPSSAFTTEIGQVAGTEQAPDIGLFPQPGLVLDLGDRGDVLSLNDRMDLAPIEESLIPGFLDAATDDEGNVYAVPMRMAVKSIVWYPKPEFEEAGYEIPTTWAELMALTEQIKADGNTPWCIGAESGPETGWVMTDWVEELVLRTGGPDVYDQWYTHEIPFNDPQIEEAASMFGEIAFGEGYVLGGPEGILSTPFGDAATPLFDEQPGCYLHRQGNFITGFFPDAVQKNLAANVGTFVLPPVEGGFDGQPILGGGDMAAMFTYDTDVVQVMEFIGSADFGGPWAQTGGWLSPHKTFDNTQYADETTRQIAELAQGADLFRFDASDLMPPSIGAGTFWDEMVAWIAGDTELPDALAAIEEDWPTS